MKNKKLWAFAPIMTVLSVILLCFFSATFVSAEEITQEVCSHQNTTIVNAVAATTESDGYTGDTQCTDCGAIISSGTEIAKIKTVSLSKTSYVYNGKARTPKITVTDSNGNKIGSSQYTVTYKNNKKVGQATVKIKFANSSYRASITETFKIKPQSVKLTSLTGVSKGFTAKWNTVSAQADGYQIQCATNSSFTKGKVKETVDGKKTSTASVTSVKAQQKYYVRIRTYKTVDGVTYYSKWSSAKTVTTKQRITVFAGDSLATGLYPSSYNGIKYVDISGTEKVVAYKGLNTLTYQTLGKFGGKSGLSTVISYKPYRVYFMLGINEIEWKSVSSTIENYSEIIEEVQKKSPATDIVILSVSPVSRSVASSRRGFRKISSLNSELKKMAKKYGVSYYDYSVAFKDSNGYQLSKYNGGDGIHWNLNGYKKFAEIISKYDASKEKKGE